MFTNLTKLLAYKDLLYMLTWRDIRIRYKQSVIGYLWAILMPSLIVGAGVLIRYGLSRYTGVPVSLDDISSVMVRAVIWAYFVSAIKFGTGCLLSNTDLVTKIAFPKEVFPISAAFSNLFDFLIAGSTVVLVLVLLGWQPTLVAFWAIPLLILIVVLSIGLVLVLSAANLFLRDVKYLVEIFFTYAIFFTPVLYDASMAGQWEYLILLNPVAPLLESISDVVVSHEAPDVGWVAYSAVFSVALFFFAYWFFKRLEAKFAEYI